VREWKTSDGIWKAKAECHAKMQVVDSSSLTRHSSSEPVKESSFNKAEIREPLINLKLFIRPVGSVGSLVANVSPS